VRAKLRSEYLNGGYLSDDLVVGGNVMLGMILRK